MGVTHELPHKSNAVSERAESPSSCVNVGGGRRGQHDLMTDCGIKVQLCAIGLFTRKISSLRQVAAPLEAPPASLSAKMVLTWSQL